MGTPLNCTTLCHDLAYHGVLTPPQHRLVHPPPTPTPAVCLAASGTGLTLNLRGLEPSQEPLAVTSRGSAPGPSWAHLARVFWPQYACLAALIVVLILTERVVPFRHVLYSHSDEELWKLSYPLRTNHVPAWAVPTIAVLAPLSAIFGWHFTGKISALEAHHAAFAALTCLAANGLATNLIKVSVGRFRPNFAARCWPNGALPRFDDQGRPACMDNAVDPAEGMKSFPSGHTSWSTAGLGFLSLWLMGPGLRCFEGRHDGPLRLVVALAPLAGAAWIGASRLQDYW